MCPDHKSDGVVALCYEPIPSYRRREVDHIGHYIMMLDVHLFKKILAHIRFFNRVWIVCIGISSSLASSLSGSRLISPFTELHNRACHMKTIIRFLGWLKQRFALCTVSPSADAPFMMCAICSHHVWFVMSVV